MCSKLTKHDSLFYNQFVSFFKLNASDIDTIIKNKVLLFVCHGTATIHQMYVVTGWFLYVPMTQLRVKVYNASEKAEEPVGRMVRMRSSSAWIFHSVSLKSGNY